MEYTTLTSTMSASVALTEIFFNILLSEDEINFESFEEKAISCAHSIMADALGKALTSYDEKLCLSGDCNLKHHDKRTRQLATEVGDISFTYHRMHDIYGNTVVPLADDLDLCWGIRISPGATSFLLEAGAHISYQKACNLLARKGGSHVSATACMNVFRREGELLEKEDAALMRDLYENGVLPVCDSVAEDICVESDGVWIPVRKRSEDDPEKVEIKALCAYDSKIEHRKKTARTNVVSHGCVTDPLSFWQEGVAAVGTKFDLSKIKTCHLGVDGEGWCKAGANILPAKDKVVAHLDPFHVNRAVMSCFAKENQKMAWQVLDVVNDGDERAAADLLKAHAAFGFAKPKAAERVAKYLINNEDIIAIEGPSLGTMESENQHLYSARMEAWPCAWSRQGASDMARIRSRMHSKRSLPRRTREQSMTSKKHNSRVRKMMAYLEKQGSSNVVKSEGHGYLPKQASVSHMSAEVRHAASVDSGMLYIKG